MSAEIISLGKARKARDKQKAEKTAAANRFKFGRNKAQKAQDKAAEDSKVRTLDFARRERKSDETPDGA